MNENNYFTSFWSWFLFRSKGQNLSRYENSAVLAGKVPWGAEEGAAKNGCWRERSFIRSSGRGFAPVVLCGETASWGCRYLWVMVVTYTTRRSPEETARAGFVKLGRRLDPPTAAGKIPSQGSSDTAPAATTCQGAIYACATRALARWPQNYFTISIGIWIFFSCTVIFFAIWVVGCLLICRVVVFFASLSFVLIFLFC